MSKESIQLHFTIFDALQQIEKNNNKLSYTKKLSKKLYHQALLCITKAFVNDEIDCDEYKAALHELCESYRKDYKHA